MEIGVRVVVRRIVVRGEVPASLLYPQPAGIDAKMHTETKLRRKSIVNLYGSQYGSIINVYKP